MATKYFVKDPRTVTDISSKILYNHTGAETLAAGDTSETFDTLDYTSCTIKVTTASFGTGNITITALNGGTSVAAETVSADGTVFVGAATSIDLTDINSLNVTRGADSNVGTTALEFVFHK